MFSAVRVWLAAFLFLSLLAASQSQPADAASKPKDFGTSQVSAQTLRGAAALAGIQSTSSIITNESVCVALFDQNPPVSIQDGGGGSIIVWSDFRSGSLDIYAQKLDAAGNIMWPGDGVPICKQTGDQTNPRLLSDGAGGAFVVWEDARTSPSDINIYIQRVNSLGVNLWATGGVAVCTAANTQRQAVVSPNGLGGVLVAWTDERGGASSADVYAQRVTSSGAVQWTANGVAVCSAAGVQQDPAVVSDTQGGAIVAWRDERAGIDLFAQRVDAAGGVQWAANGIAISSATGNQEAPQMIPDGSGGAILTWVDSRGADQDVYAQRVNGAGAVQWTVDGTAVILAPAHQRSPRLATDGAGGAYVVWEDLQAVGDANIFAQRLDAATGAPQWGASGLVVCASLTNQLSPAIAADPVGGAIVAWSDDRNASGTDVYAQHIQPGGSVLWNPDGVRLCDASGTQDRPDVVADGSGGASIAWRDYRNTSYSDIYAQRIDALGQVPDQCVPPDTLSTNTPVNTVATQNYKMFDQGWFYWSGVSVRGGTGDWDIEMFDQGSTGLGTYPTCFGLPLAGSYGASGADFVISNFNDNHTPPGVFGVRAYRYSGTGNASIEWDDGPDQMSVGGTVSKIGWPDVLDVYDIQLTAGITYTFDLTHTPEADIKVLLFTSFEAPGGGYYYVAPRSARVMETPGRYGTYTAPSTEFYGVAVVNDNGVPGDYVLTVRAGVTGVGDGDAPVTQLMALAPNPGRGPVNIHFAMRETGLVSFEIFDMAGRAVASIPTARWQPGTWSTQWNGRDSQGRRLSAGVYFVQMNVNDRRVGMGRIALIH
ncbi:MAG TPA: FlgD immunoglobulin-like domain containing protein [Candidatus Eisenbacteria bacterium]|nr:FlgD immunoglobulin-like domain containing protein [Candidatus Eisenbacteria bacterium]